MKIYFAGVGMPFKLEMSFRKNSIEEENCVLRSYLEVKSTGPQYPLLTKNVKSIKKQIFLDSGAFTAFTQGTKIDIDDYIKVIKESNVSLYACLDVIGDWRATKKNQEYMESQGLEPLPTFHYQSPLSELRRLCNKYDYIALGGLVPLAMKRKVMCSWLDKCWKVIFEESVKKGKPLTKVHGFGVNSFFIWDKYPFYSVDATSWVVGGRFRKVIKFQNNKIMGFTKSSVLCLQALKCWKKDYTDLNIQNLREYRKAADFITRVWEKRGIKFTNN